MKKVYGVYSGCIFEGGGVSGTLYQDKYAAIKECIKLFKSNQRTDRADRKYVLENEKDPASLEYSIQHAKQYKWRKHKTYENYWHNTVDCITIQEFDLI